MKNLKIRFIPNTWKAIAGAISLIVTGGSAHAQDGLTAQYFNNTSLAGASVSRTDSTINFSPLAPPSGVGANNFSVRWLGQVIAGPQTTVAPSAVPAGSSPLTFLYNFQVASNNGVRLWVNEKLIIDSWVRPQGPATDTGSIRLAPNAKYDIKLEYRDTPTADTPSVSLQWSYPGQSLQVIPQSRLSTERNGLLAEFYNHNTLRNFILARTDPNIDYNYGLGSPDSMLLEGNSFAARWSGNLSVPAAGAYTFRTTIHNAAEEVRLWVNDVLVIDHPANQTGTSFQTSPITLPAGNVAIRMEYVEGGNGIALAKLEWSGPSLPMQVIPQDRLTPPAGNQLNLLLEEKRFPFNAGVINVKTYYGVKGDGVTDDTAALQRAISENVGWGIGFNRLLYLPAGTYLVSNTLRWRDGAVISAEMQWKAGLGLVGDGQAQTIIKLRNNTFTNTASPQAVLMTGSSFFTTSEGVNRAIGEGNEAALNSFADLTIDTGTGNPGAIGLDYLGNNQGFVTNVTIRSGDGNGIAALSLRRRFPGPAMIGNVTMEGFNYGIDMGGNVPEFGMTFENITVRNQKIAGVFLQENTLQIRGLTSEGDKPVILNTSAGTHQGFIAIADGTFTYTGSAPAPSAISLADSRIFARNISSPGYASTLQGRAGNTISELTALNAGLPSATANPFGTSASSLNLPVQQTPVFDDTNLNNWVDATSFGANPVDSLDDRAAIQAAIDSFLPGGANAAKTTLFLPTTGKSYHLSGPVIVRGNIRRIIGHGCGIRYLPGTYQTGPVLPYFSFQQTAFDVTFESINSGLNATTAPSACFLEHRSPTALIIRDCALTGGVREAYRNAQPAGGGEPGTLFMENIVGRVFNMDRPQTAFARQLNLEGPPAALSFIGAGIPWVKNAGGSFWVLGLKTENQSVLVETLNNGQTEVLGGLIYPTVNVPTNIPAFRSIDSQSSYVIAESSYAGAQRYTIHVSETRGAVTRTFGRAQIGNGLYQRGSSFGSVIPLYIGHAAPAPTQKTAVLVVGSPSPLSAVDGALKTRLETNLGFVVTVLDDNLSSPSSGDGSDLVLLSPTVVESAVTTKFRNANVPVLCSRAILFDDMSMSVLALTTSASHTQVNVTPSSNPVYLPLSAGFPAGNRTVYTTTATLNMGRANANGANIALIPGTTTNQAGIFAYEAGAVMEGSLPAPQRRVGFFLSSTSNLLSADGWALFDAAVNWAAQ